MFKPAWILLLVGLMTAGCSRPDVGDDDGERHDAGDGGTDAGDAVDGGDDVRPDGDSIVSGDDGGPDEVAPCLLNAFSPSAGVLAAHFSEPVDPQTAGDVSNYTVRGSSGDTIGLSSASVDGSYVRLQVAAGTSFVPGTTYSMLVDDVTDLAGNPVGSTCRRADDIKRTLFLNIIWHQHQPLYLEPVKDQLLSPWVRKHATKDYYDMASILRDYPHVHYNVNLTSVLLNQLVAYYVERLGPYVDVQNDRVDEEAFLAHWEGKTDPWIDLLLKDTPSPTEVTEVELGLLHKDAWSCVSTSDALMKRFPEYREHVIPTPAPVAQCGPVVVIDLLAAHVDHRVDGGAAAEHPAPGIAQRTTVQPRLRSGLEAPVCAGIADGEQVAHRDIDPEIIVIAACLQQ